MAFDLGPLQPLRDAREIRLVQLADELWIRLFNNTKGIQNATRMSASHSQTLVGEEGELT